VDTDEGLFRAIWEKAADAMALSDSEGTVLLANAAYYALYGYGPDEVIGRNFAVIFPEEMRAWANEVYQTIFSGTDVPPPVETVVRRKDGVERVVEARVDFLVDAEGRRTAMLNIVRDVTERKQAEEAAQRAQARAESALRARDDFMATISHDLQNPLSAIKGHAQMLRRRMERGGATLPRLTENALAIESTATQMSAQVDELLDLVRVQAGEPVQLARRPTDLVALTGIVVEAYAGVLANHVVRVDAAEPTLTGEWDPVRMRRVLANLLTNAAKYSPPGSEIEVRLWREGGADDGWALIAVRDRGIGIPAADLPRIAERFHRAANVPADVPGTGLGLHSARYILELHGGSLSVESEEGRGSTFTVRLPL
jgi:PAS domain S-box-containing protein